MEDLANGAPAAEAPPPADEGASDTSREAGRSPVGNSVNGYIDNRFNFQRAKTDGLLSTRDLAQVDDLIELNVQLKHTYTAAGFVYGDMSAFAQFAGSYRTLDVMGREIEFADHAVATYLPLFSLNEFYLSHDVTRQVNLTFGKKRMVWGPGFAFNPTDLLDPPKDPTNPTFQRAGFWMARAEANFGEYAATLVAAPAVTEQAVGLPYAFLKYPAWDRKDKQAHFQLAARLYAGIANADINLMVFYGNRYNDAFTDKWRFGASFSRYFFTDYEVHAEVLLQTGSVQNYPNTPCFTDPGAALQCVRSGAPLTVQSRLNDKALFPRLIAGTRRQFSDESVLSLEYYFQADGYTQEEFQRFVYLLELMNLATISSPAQTTGGGIPQNYTFNPTGKHYLIASYSKPKIGEDWTLGLTLIASLNDLSTFISPTVAWSVQDWITLSLYGFIPAPGPNSLAVTTTSGKHVSEFSVANSYYRILFEARVFY